MPPTLTFTEGVLPKGAEKIAFKKLGDAMRKWHGLLGNIKSVHGAWGVAGRAMTNTQLVAAMSKI